MSRESTCPKCNSGDISYPGNAYAYYPIYVVIASVLLSAASLLFINGYFALVVCAGVLIAGHFVRKHFQAIFVSCRCNQCQTVFAPGA
jgi:hypothetical protein